MKFFLTLKNIPEIKTSQDRYISADNREKAVYLFAVRIAQRKYSNNMWKAKLNDIKKDIKSYVVLVTPFQENKMKKSELKQIIKEEIKKLNEARNPLISQVSKSIEWDYNEACEFVRDLLIDINAHDEANKVYNFMIKL